MKVFDDLPKEEQQKVRKHSFVNFQYAQNTINQ